jgi:hypothetical protein
MDLTLRPTTLEDLPILFEHQADPIGAMGATGARAARRAGLRGTGHGSVALRHSPLARQVDCDGIATRHHWPCATQGHMVDVDPREARMRTRVLLIGGLSLVLVGVFGAGYTLRDLARGITETPSHWWSTAPWIVIVLGVGLLVLARISHRRPTAS